MTATAINHTGNPFTISATGLYSLGTGHQYTNSLINVHLVSNSFSGSVTIVARNLTAAQTSPNDDTLAPVAIPYTKLYLNGSVADGSTVSTAITTTSLIQVPASGMEILINAGTVTSGTLTVYFTPLMGRL